MLAEWCVSAEPSAPRIRTRTSATSSPSVSFRNRRSGTEATITPPFQNSKPVGLWTWAKVMARSATPSRSSSGRIRSRSFISRVGSHFG